MENKIYDHNNKSEYTMVYLFCLLFYISFIESYRLMTITALVIVIYSVYTLKSLNVFKQIKPVLAFILLMLLPLVLSYIFTGQLRDIDFSLKIIFKISMSSILLGTIVEKYSNLYLVDGILNIGFPPVFNRILALTFRYFHMVYDDVTKGKDGLISRGILERKGLTNLNIFGQWIGGFFLKSSNHSDMVFNAMKSRGFQGESRGSLFANKRLLLHLLVVALTLLAILLIDKKVTYGN